MVPATCALVFGRHNHDFNRLHAQALKALLIVLLLEGSGKIHHTKGQGNDEQAGKIYQVTLKAMRKIFQED